MRTIQRALFVVLLAIAGAAMADGVAFISNLKGEVVADGGARLAFLAEVSPGQKLGVAKDSQATLLFIASGKEFTLRGPGEYVVRATDVAATGGAQMTTRDTEWRTSSRVVVKVSQTAAASVRMRSLTPPKPEPAPALLFPTQGNIASLQPVFRWAQAPAKAEFALYVAGDEKPVHRAKPAGLTHRVPGALKPDTEYTWSLASDGKEVGTGRFRTLPLAAVQLAQKRRPTEKSEFGDRVLYALYLNELGAEQEAHEAWQRLSLERPDLPELASLAK
jgi:hypothetical protein